MKVQYYPKNPSIVVICGDGRTDRNIIKCIAKKLNGSSYGKSIWIYEVPLITELKDRKLFFSSIS